MLLIILVITRDYDLCNESCGPEYNDKRNRLLRAQSLQTATLHDSFRCLPGSTVLLLDQTLAEQRPSDWKFASSLDDDNVVKVTRSPSGHFLIFESRRNHDARMIKETLPIRLSLSPFSFCNGLRMSLLSSILIMRFDRACYRGDGLEGLYFSRLQWPHERINLAEFGSTVDSSYTSIVLGLSYLIRNCNLPGMQVEGGVQYSSKYNTNRKKKEKKTARKASS